MLNDSSDLKNIRDLKLTGVVLHNKSGSSLSGLDLSNVQLPDSLKLLRAADLLLPELRELRSQPRPRPDLSSPPDFVAFLFNDRYYALSSELEVCRPLFYRVKDSLRMARIQLSTDQVKEALLEWPILQKMLPKKEGAIQRLNQNCYSYFYFLLNQKMIEQKVPYYLGSSCGDDYRAWKLNEIQLISETSEHSEVRIQSLALRPPASVQIQAEHSATLEHPSTNFKDQSALKTQYTGLGDQQTPLNDQTTTLENQSPAPKEQPTNLEAVQGLDETHEEPGENSNLVEEVSKKIDQTCTSLTLNAKKPSDCYFDFGIWSPDTQNFEWRDLGHLAEPFTLEQPKFFRPPLVHRLDPEHLQEVFQGGDLTRTFLFSELTPANLLEQSLQLQYDVQKDFPRFEWSDQKAGFALHFGDPEELNQLGPDELSSDSSTRILLHPDIENPVGKGQAQCAPLWFLDGLDRGFSGALEINHLEVATKVRSKRAHELKLLKNPNFYALSLFETLSFFFDGKNSQGVRLADFDDFWAHFCDQLADLLSTQKGQDLDSLVSLRVQSLIRAYCESLVEWAKAPAQINCLKQGDGSEYLCTRLNNRDYFQFLYCQLLSMTYHPDIVAFSKSGHRIWRNTVKAQSGFLDLPGDLESILISLAMDRGLSVFHKGQLVGRIEDESQFEFRVNLQKKDGPNRRDWFALHPEIFFDGKKIEKLSLRPDGSANVLEHEGKFYLVDLRKLPKMSELTQLWNRIFTDGTGGKQKTQDESDGHQKNRTLELMALRAAGAKIQGDQEWQEIEAHLKTVEERDSLSTQIEADEILLPYQKIGLQWIYDLAKLKLGGILADDMGLGKTLQALRYLEQQAFTQEGAKHLIVVPPSLVHNWDAEIAKFCPNMNRRLILFSKEVQLEEVGIYITTYGILSANSEKFEEIQWASLIFDEAQYLKNSRSKRASAARKLHADFRMALTGTPLENSLEELFNIVDLVLPGALGQKKSLLKESSPKDLELVRKVLKPILLRRTKNQVALDLPKKTEQTLKIPLETEQLRIYRDIALSMKTQVEAEAQTKSEKQLQIKMLSALMRLRQVCSDPAAVPGVNYPQIPVKMETLLELILPVVQKGESCLVFTQFLSSFDRIETSLKKANVPTFSIQGKNSGAERSKAITAFDNCEEGAVMLMTLRTGGVGLNLTKASYVFHLEPWWNPAVENQATDRAHRLGQTKPVSVYYMIMQDTLEEKIEKLKESKKALFESILMSDEETLNLPEQTGGGHKISLQAFRALLD